MALLMNNDFLPVLLYEIMTFLENSEDESIQ